MAEAVFAGAQDKEIDGVSVRMLQAQEACASDLLWANALILGTPENFGYMSGALKDFFDRTYYPAEPYKLNLPYGVFISAENDGTGAARDIDRIAKGYPLRKISEPVIAKGAINADYLQQCQDLGAAMAAGLALGIY